MFIAFLMFFVLTDNQHFNFFTQQKSPEINRGLKKSGATIGYPERLFFVFLIMET